MLKKYSNEIADILKATPDFGNRDLHLDKEGDGFVVRYRHNPKFVFKFWAVGATTFRAQRSMYGSRYQGGYPVERKISDLQPMGHNFADVKDQLAGWLGDIRKYLKDEEVIRQDAEVPDLWTLDDVGGLASSAASASGLDAPFEQHERDQVRQSLQELLEKVSESQLLTDGQMKRLTGHVERMITDAQSWKLSKREWLGLTLGGILNVVVATAFSKDASQFVWRLLGDALHWMMVEGQRFLPQ